MRLALLAVASLFLVSAAPAGPVIPRYDVDGLCQRTAGARGGAPAKNQCVQQEQAEYDLLKLYWKTYRPEIRKRCLDTVKAPLQTYGGLARCLRALTPLDDSKKAEPFRY